jgi:hypothetical protein
LPFQTRLTHLVMSFQEGKCELRDVIYTSTTVEVNLHFSSLITLSPFQYFIHRPIKHQALGPFFAEDYEITEGNQGSRKILRS